MTVNFVVQSNYEVKSIDLLIVNLLSFLIEAAALEELKSSSYKFVISAKMLVCASL